MRRATERGDDALTVRLPGGRVAGYAQYGDPAGLPVLALHGAPACRMMFAVADGHARRHGLRLIAPDRPGYGVTPPDNPPTLQRRTGWLIAITDALQLERFAVLGISGGGPYAVALAAALSERITALALVAPMGPVAEYEGSEEGREKPLSFVHKRFFLRLPYQTWLTHPLGDLGAAIFKLVPNRLSGIVPSIASPVDAAILARPGVREVMLAMTLEAFRQGAAGGTADMEIYARPWNVDYQSITAPSVLWQGTADRVVPPQVSAYLAARLPHCDYRTLEGAGHFWIFDRVETVVSHLGEMVRG
jgi:pimeloyl-ACP methyl ester carboxylesterase